MASRFVVCKDKAEAQRMADAGLLVCKFTDGWWAPEDIVVGMIMMQSETLYGPQKTSRIWSRKTKMASRYQIIECPYRQVEYRKAGLLFYKEPGWAGDGWAGKKFGWLKARGLTDVAKQNELMDSGYTYAILVEEDDSPTSGVVAPAQ